MKESSVSVDHLIMSTAATLRVADVDMKAGVEGVDSVSCFACLLIVAKVPLCEIVNRVASAVSR